MNLLRSYWSWMLEGSKWRLAAGIGGPVFVLLLIIAAVAPGSEDPGDAGESIAQPATSVPVPPGQDPTPTSTAETNTATPEPVVETHTVQRGDSLSQICENLVPDLASPICVAEIVRLNLLASASQIDVGQVLLIPVVKTSAAVSSTANDVIVESTSTEVLGPSATPVTDPTRTAIPTLTATSLPTATPVPDLCGAPANPYGYNFCPGGSVISNPQSDICDYVACIGNFWNGNGYVIQCKDGTFGKSGGISGSCSGHGGNLRALTTP